MSALRSGGLGTPENAINDSKGCGGVMRVAPLGLLPDHLVASQAFQLGARAAAITHTHPTGYVAAGVLAATVRELMAGGASAD